MELITLLCVLFSLLAGSLVYLSTRGNGHNKLLPPGKTGWPVIGESIDFLICMQRGHLEKFSFKRMAKYSPSVFKTSLLGNHVAVFCGSEGSKFMFNNSHKLVVRDLPGNFRKVLGNREFEATIDGYMKPALLAFIKADNLSRFVGVMDTIAQRHLESWRGQAITVYPSVKKYLFALACRFLSIEDDHEILEKMYGPMQAIMAGIQSLPINLPGTRCNRAIKETASLMLQIDSIVKHQRSVEESSSSSSGSSHDQKNFLSYLMQAYEDDKLVSVGVLGFLLGGYETSSSVLCMIFKVLAENPDVYQKVYEENMEIMALKTSGEALTREDTQRMRYTWNVAREVMRLYSPTPYLSREANVDFKFADYLIPKGFKLIANIHAIHKDPKYFPEPEKFDPSRFDGDGPLPNTYMPFGGGSYMCPGMAYAQLAILVFLHNAVMRFKWESVITGEKIVGIPHPKPAKGLPIHLHPHTI